MTKKGSEPWHRSQEANPTVSHKQLNIRVTPDEWRMIYYAAKGEGLTMSNWLRKQAYKGAGK